MNEIAQVLFTNFALVMACMLLLWLISIPLRDVSYVDSFWAAGFVIVASSTYFMTGGGSDRRQLILLITAIWGARLAAYLFLRWRREGPDGRYVSLLSRAPGNVHLHSLMRVFLLQGPILWIVSLPVQLGQIPTEPLELGPLAWCGALLAATGIFFEAVGDQQMAAFKADPANTGKVMDRGLWRYTRHPNYFGDCCVFWGLFLIAAETPLGLWSVFGPILLTWTLVRWSGAALLERRLRRSRPGYEDYLRRTSAFIPWPPKRDGNSSTAGAAATKSRERSP
jgi:steroid 5-alpha reductase family enzyme